MVDVPIGVKVISVLYFIKAAFGLLFGLLSIIAAGFIGGLLMRMPFISAVSAGMMTGMGMVMVLFAVLAYFIGMGLWKGEQWARATAIIIALLAVIFPFFMLLAGVFGTIVPILLNLIIALYLIFAPDVKRAFR